HFTESLGTSLGGSFPAKFRNGFDTRARKWGFDWSLAQHTNAAELGLNMSAPYAHATQDLGRFIVADTVYTAISAGTIYPIMKYLQRAPLVGPMFAKVMSYKSKHAPNSPTLDGDKIKVPSNRYADEAPVAALSRAVEEVKPAETIEEKPRAKVSNIRDRSALSQQPQHHLA
ncbi:MAG: hypothetical protein ACOYNL_09895, partial [Rickettsiales bacterium]